MTESEFTDWYCGARMVSPASTRRVRSSAKKVIDDPACSNAIQKKMLKNASTAMAAMPRHSSRVSGGGDSDGVLVSATARRAAGTSPMVPR